MMSEETKVAMLLTAKPARSARAMSLVGKDGRPDKEQFKVVVKELVEEARQSLLSMGAGVSVVKALLSLKVAWAQTWKAETVKSAEFALSAVAAATEAVDVAYGYLENDAFWAEGEPNRKLRLKVLGAVHETMKKAHACKGAFDLLEDAIQSSSTKEGVSDE